MQVSELRTALDSASKTSAARALYDTHELTAVQQDAAGSVSGDERVVRVKQLLQSTVPAARSRSPTTQRSAPSRAIPTTSTGKQATNKASVPAAVGADAAVEHTSKQTSHNAAHDVVTALLAEIITTACDSGEQFVLARVRQADFVARNVHKPLTVVTSLASYV